ncbi:hypothetical protein EDC94DRAFT_617032 [Helicostylum pulchrum]|nr:hypothetical protein EDC94DRAFT_617032 [Helicostylum pulchrum]
MARVARIRNTTILFFVLLIYDADNSIFCQKTTILSKLFMYKDITCFLVSRNLPAVRLMSCSNAVDGDITNKDWEKE